LLNKIKDGTIEACNDYKTTEEKVEFNN